MTVRIEDALNAIKLNNLDDESRLAAYALSEALTEEMTMLFETYMKNIVKKFNKALKKQLKKEKIKFEVEYDLQLLEKEIRMISRYGIKRVCHAFNE